MEKVLVTGGSGYIALHCIAELLKRGFYVRTSLRTVDKKKEIINSLQKIVHLKDMLEFCILDLMEDKGWDKAVQGCTYVMHMCVCVFICLCKTVYIYIYIYIVLDKYPYIYIYNII